MTATTPDLRLSAQRALLGAIRHGVRLVTVTIEGDVIAFQAVLASDHDALAEKELSCAMTEIVADFPDNRFTEKYLVNDDPLPSGGPFDGGWVFARHEPAAKVH